jgi:hypothetical protein
MLAQEGTALENVGSAGSGIGCCWVPPSLHSLSTTPMQGEVGRLGEGRASVAPACLDMPSTPEEGEAWGRGVGCSAISFDRPAAPPARWGVVEGSMATGLTPLSQRARGREVLTPRGIAEN